MHGETMSHRGSQCCPWVEPFLPLLTLWLLLLHLLHLLPPSPLPTWTRVLPTAHTHVLVMHQIVPRLCLHAGWVTRSTTQPIYMPPGVSPLLTCMYIVTKNFMCKTNSKIKLVTISIQWQKSWSCFSRLLPLLSFPSILESLLYIYIYILLPPSLVKISWTNLWRKSTNKIIFTVSGTKHTFYKW